LHGFKAFALKTFKMKTAILFAAAACFFACQAKQPPVNQTTVYYDSLCVQASNPNPKTIASIALPAGFVLDKALPNSFASYLYNLNLKEDNTVYLYNGDKKANQAAQFAVVNISIGEKDLQQCADAAMRLRAEYLFEQKQYAAIVFYDNNKKAYRFTAPYTRANLDKFLLRVFGMCGSASLEKQLKPKIDFTKIAAGDVIIKGGFPGHAVIVMAIATNKAGEKIYMLAQSYMPAQDIHILLNPSATQKQPWYYVTAGENIETPEYHFEKKHLRAW
jgi:hypothetical protein